MTLSSICRARLHAPLFALVASLMLMANVRPVLRGHSVLPELLRVRIVQRIKYPPQVLHRAPHVLLVKVPHQ